MQSRSNPHQVMQIIFIVCLMGIISWLATGWQETTPLQLSEQDNQLGTIPWSEAHLITPVVAQQTRSSSEQLRAM